MEIVYLRMKSTEETRSYHYTKYYPPKPLEEHVKFFYSFKSDSETMERVLPTGSSEITIRVNRPIAEDDILIVNPATTFMTEKPKDLGEIIGACFYPWGFHDLFKIPPSEVLNQKLLLADVVSPGFKKLLDLAKGECDNLSMIRTLQRYLLSRLSHKSNSIIRDAVNYINHQKGQLDLHILYKRYNISERRFQQLFKTSIGMTPKRYCLLKKFHSAVTLLTRQTNLTDLGLSLDYYDQAHFIHEFKSFAGICPSSLIKESNFLNEINAEAYF